MTPKRDLLSQTPADDRAYLQSAGWTIERDMWMDPRKDAAYHARMGGFCNPANAVKAQRDYDRWDKGLPVYAVCSARDQYGYLLRRCDGPDKPYTTVTRFHDEKRLQLMADRINAETDARQLVSDEEMLRATVDIHIYPYLLLCEEKHGTFRFHVPTRAAFHAACLSVVKRRNEEGYWYDYSSTAPVVPALNKTTVTALPDGRIKTAALEEWTHYEATVKRRKAEEKESALLAKALTGDGEAAADFLALRKRGEYEGFEVVTFDEPDLSTP